MSNFDEFQRAPEADPFDEFERAAPPVRTVLKAAATIKPDDMAEAERLAKRYPAPVDTLYRNLADVRLQAAVDDADERLRTSPKLAAALAQNPRLATVAHDDVGPLADLEQFTRDIGGAIKAGVFRASRGAAGTFQAGLELVAPVLDILEPYNDQQMVGWRGEIGGNPLRRLAEGFAISGEGAGQTAKAAMPKTNGVVMGGFFSGVQSLTQNLLVLPAAFLPGGQAFALGGMTAMTGGDAYQTAREQGLPMQQALPFAASQAAIEYATEKLPLATLLKDVKAGTGFLQVLGRQIALEVPGEQIATVLQDLNEWAVLPENAGKPFSAYIEERPSAAAQTLVATIVGTGGNVAVVKGIEAAIERATRDGVNMQRAGILGQALEQAMKGAEASALRERSPEQFRAVLNQMTDDGAVYVDAEVLNQLPADILQQMEGVAAELPAALAIGASVPVKVADALTLLPGTPHAETFLQNARSAPDAPSLVEAEAAGKKAQEYLQQEAERVILAAQDQEAARASQEAVKQNIKAQLAATGRFRDAVNEGYATWASAFYTAYGSRVGVTPEQFFQRYPLRILGAPSGVASPVMEQRQASEAVPTGAISPITRKPIMELRDANGQRIGLTHSYDTPKEALEKFNAPKTSAAPAPTYTLPEPELPKRSNWKQVKGQKFTALDEDDGFLYHVTAAPNAAGIREDGLVPGDGSTFGGAYAGYSKGKVFLTERSGVSFWKDKVEQMLFHNSDNPPAVVVMRIPKDKVKAPLTPDDIGTQDANARAYFATETLRQPAAGQGGAGRLEQGRPSMTEDEYIQRINPEGRRIPEGYRPVEYAADMGDMLGSGIRTTALGTHRVKGGLSIKVVLDSVGGVFAVHKGKVIGYMAGGDRETQLSVAQEYQGKGIGSLLSRYYRTRNPFAPSGGLTEGGERAARSAYRYMVANGLFDPPGQPAADPGGAGRLEQSAGLALVGGYQSVTVGDTTVDVTVSTGRAEISMVRTPDDKRGQGSARRALEQVLAAADARGLQVVLTAEPMDRKTSKAKLEKFYKSMGFKPNKGRNKDFTTQAGMVREARAPTLKQSDGFDRFVGDATRVDLGDAHEFKDGEPVVVAALHGTTGDFTAFDPAMANIESDLGGGFYFTNNPADVGENYAGMGPDLTNKIQLEAERLESVDDLDPDEAQRIARDKWMANEGLTMPVWVKLQKPVVLGGSRETFLTYEESYNEETDEYGEPTGTLVDVIDALREVAQDERYGDADVEQTIGEIMERALDNGGISARELIATAKLSEGLQYAADYESDGKLASTEILRRAFEGAGFDGFIDQTVGEKFGSQSEGQRKYGKGMKGMDADTVHFIAFKPTQIKSRLGNSGAFDESDPDILKQGPRGTFNPASLELVLNPNANLSTFFHETGHFFLEVMADIASQPDAPAQIVEDMSTFLKWAGIKGDENVGGQDAGGELAQMPPPAGFETKVVGPDGAPAIVYHGTGVDIQKMRTTGGDGKTHDTGAFFSSSPAIAATYATGEGPNVVPVYLALKTPVVIDAGGANWNRIAQKAKVELPAIEVSDQADENLLAELEGRQPAQGVTKKRKAKKTNVRELFKGEWDYPDDTASTDDLARWARKQGYDGLIVRNVMDHGPSGRFATEDKVSDIFVAFYPEQVVSSLTGEPLAQDGQPTAPTQPITPRRTPLETWNAMTLDQKRPYHERWAESIEQYVMEGRAPSVELQPLMRRFASWLKSVYGSIKAFLASRGVAPAGGSSLEQSAYHGTPHRGIEKFSTDKIGTGEGAQAYGWGLYFASKREIAEWYRKKLSGGDSGTFTKDGKTLESTADLAEAYYQPGRLVRGYSGTDKVLEFKKTTEFGWTVKVVGVRADGSPMASERPRWHATFPDAPTLRSVLEADGWKAGEPGQLYEVEIPEDSEMLLWDRPLSEQPAKVREALLPYLQAEVDRREADRQALNAKNPGRLTHPVLSKLKSVTQPVTADDIKGQSAYETVSKTLGGDQQASEALMAAGVKGIKYLDGTSRGAGDGTFNYVVFSGDDVQIRNQFYQGGDPSGPQMALNDDIRRVMDRMLATDEQIAQANEVAGLMPDEDADALANERLRKRSVADLKWSVRARDAAIAKLQKQAKAIEKGIREQVTAEVSQRPEVLAKEMLAKTQKENGGKLNDTERAIIADAFGYESVDVMLKAIDAFGSKKDVIDGVTEQRMLEEHGDLVDERAIQQAANEAVHNEARARSLATELRTQAEMLGARTDTGETNAKGSRITVNALVEAAKQFAANVVGRTPLRDLRSKSWQHTAAERRAAKRWQEATAAGKTEDAVKAKQDQMLNHAAAKAALDAQAESQKILDFFRRVTKGNDEKVVERGRDPDIVNAARAVLAAYGVESPASKGAQAYLDVLKTSDPETYAVIEPMVQAATQNAQPLDSLTFDELTALHEEVQAMWHLAKRSRQMEVDGDLIDIDDAADEVYARLEQIGIPDTVPGESGALTRAEIVARQWLQQAPALLRRVEQWAEAKDGKFGGPFLRFVFQPVKDAADRYRTDRLAYRAKFQALVDKVAPTFTKGTVEAPELGYTFGRGHNGIGHAELLHALLHTGNESNKRKLLLGRGWATENADGTLDTARWDAFIKRAADTGVLQPAHYDFAQGVWDLMEETKPLAQKTHRDVFGRYFAEVTAEAFTDPWGQARSGGYVPAQADPLLAQDADLRELLETENAGMSQAFPATARGFTKARVDYNRPLKLDLRTLPQHIDKVLLFSHMEPAVRGVARLLRNKKVGQPLARVDPAAMGGMLKPWLNRAARQTVETPISADAGLNRMASTVRGRVGMALMFANVSNTLQQITGAFTAAIKVKPAHMTRALAQYIANPKKLKDSVWTLSPYMADRANNEVAVLSDTLEAILVNPTTYQRAEQFTRRHAYFMQTFLDNQMSPIIWTGAYNQGLVEGMDERMAARFADGVIRQTQGSTLPEDVSRIETGPAYARLFTQFVGYFNMMANTNATAVQQIAGEVGLKKGAGKALGVLTIGLLVPIWIAEAIAHAMRGGPEDEDEDGYLDDWLAAVFGFGTIRGILAGVPFLGAAAQSAVNRFNDQPADDKFSLSPTVSVLESAVGAPASVYKAIVDDASAQKALRDASALITVTTGLPAMAAARPLGYLTGIADDRIEPTGPADMARGLITGTASPESKIQR